MQKQYQVHRPPTMIGTKAEELINQIASCHATLAQKYEEINKVVPHMSKTQLALYLGKVPVIPLVKPEAGHVVKVYSEEKAEDPNYDFGVQGDSWEEKLDFLVKHVLAERLLFAIAIGDMQYQPILTSAYCA